MQANSVRNQSSVIEVDAPKDQAREMVVRSATELAGKRLLDISIAIVALTILLPFVILIAFAVKLQDGGPIIYRRRVVGPKGQFDAYKFRSMHVDADAALEGNPALREAFKKNFKLIYDPRVTPLGVWLRRFSLDEIPQLVNVLKGEMSLVGPRMITLEELAKYEELSDLLLTVKPGLTGYWQVHGRQNVDYGDRVRMDIWYIQNWSLSLDVKLLMMTPFSVIRGVGAY